MQTPFALIVAGAAFTAAVLVSVGAQDRRDRVPGARADRTASRRSVALLELTTRNIDQLFMMDARDAARDLLKQEATSLATSLQSELRDVASMRRPEGRAKLSKARDLHRRSNQLVAAHERLAAIEVPTLAGLISSHACRVGDDPAGVCGVEGTTAWLLGGLRAHGEAAKGAVLSALGRADRDKPEEMARRGVLTSLLDMTDRPWDVRKGLSILEHAYPLFCASRHAWKSQTGSGPADLLTLEGMNAELHRLLR